MRCHVSFVGDEEYPWTGYCVHTLCREFRACVPEMSSARSSRYLLYTLKVHSNRNTEWISLGHRPARALDTIVLPSELKKDIVDEATTFFKESTRAWYASHGIPYRRNLMFFGDGTYYYYYTYVRPHAI